MWFYQSIEPVDFLKGSKFISFIGGGGKTSFIKYLAGEFSKKGEKVVITTTTKIWAEEPFLLLQGDGDIGRDCVNPVMIGKTVEGGKLTAISEKDIEYLGRRFERVLIEADGAKGKSIKFPASYEPVIPALTDKVIVLCGLDSLFKRIDDVVFRWGMLCDITGLSCHEIVNPEIFLGFFSRDILLKGTEKKDFLIILNKYDICEGRDIISDIAKNLIRRLRIDEVYISSLIHRVFYRISYCKGIL